MFDRPPLDFLHIPFSARLLSGFGHHSGHRASGIIFGARLLEIGLAAVVIMVVASMATLAVSDWVEKRYGNTDYVSIAGWLVFLAIVLVLGLGLARFV